MEARFQAIEDFFFLSLPVDISIIPVSKIEDSAVDISVFGGPEKQ